MSLPISESNIFDGFHFKQNTVTIVDHSRLVFYQMNRKVLRGILMFRSINVKKYICDSSELLCAVRDNKCKRICMFKCLSIKKMIFQVL